MRNLEQQWGVRGACSEFFAPISCTNDLIIQMNHLSQGRRYILPYTSLHLGQAHAHTTKTYATAQKKGKTEVKGGVMVLEALSAWQDMN